MQPIFIAHRTDENEQLLIDHLNAVAEMAENFSCPLMKPLAYNAGLYHDLGKYSDAFQKRIRGSSIQVEHALPGALEIAKKHKAAPISALLLQYIITGHHSGIPDGGAKADEECLPTLFARLKRKPEDCSAYEQELDGDKSVAGELDKMLKKLFKADRQLDAIELFAFFTRYVYSCLTDADFIDTEKFCLPETDRKVTGNNFKLALEKLDSKLNAFVADTPVKKARGNLLNQVKSAVNASAEINLLNMPTGSGKTLASLKAALEIALKEGKKRIIYIIPYTSIIEQTADTFEKIFDGSLTILQHHSNFDYESDEDFKNNDTKNATYTTAQKLKKATENWDCPLIITTNVQFFESLYHFKSSKLRKMHSLTDSVMVFDEIHMLPIPYLQPCIRAVGNITKYLNSKAIFLSATMPEYDKLFEKYIPDSSRKNLISDSACYESFKNQQISYIGEKSYEALVQLAAGYASALIVAGTRNAAREIYKLVSGNKYHLSTYMTASHRTAVFKKIREDLDNEKNVTVVSTSLIEAGVDLDFETVFREISGLDSILQSAGRCNREGKREKGDVFVYATSEKQKGEVEIRANIAAALFNHHEDISSQDCIKSYFDELYGFHFDKIDRNSIAGTKENPVFFNYLPFREYSDKFHLIDPETIGVVIDRTEETSKLLNILSFGGFRVKRSLQKETVSVRRYEFESMLKEGIVREVNGVYVLSNNDYYSDDYGLSINEHKDSNYII